MSGLGEKERERKRRRRRRVIPRFRLPVPDNSSDEEEDLPRRRQNRGDFLGESSRRSASCSFDTEEELLRPFQRLGRLGGSVDTEDEVVDLTNDCRQECPLTGEEYESWRYKPCPQCRQSISNEAWNQWVRKRGTCPFCAQQVVVLKKPPPPLVDLNAITPPRFSPSPPRLFSSPQLIDTSEDEEEDPLGWARIRRLFPDSSSDEEEEEEEAPQEASPPRSALSQASRDVLDQLLPDLSDSSSDELPSPRPPPSHVSPPHPSPPPSPPLSGLDLLATVAERDWRK